MGIEKKKKSWHGLNEEKQTTNYQEGTDSNNTLNQKLAMATPETLIVGVLASPSLCLAGAGDYGGHGQPAPCQKAKELDDNSPTKRDDKDAGVIARLARDGRFHLPHIPTGVMADIHNLVNFRVPNNLPFYLLSARCGQLLL